MNSGNTIAVLSYWWAPVMALTLWWLSTALLLFLNHLPRKTYLVSMAIISIAMLYCFARVPVVSGNISYLHVILAFIQGLVIWAWLEMSYFMGLITGP